MHFLWELDIVQRRAGALDGGYPYNLVQGPPGSILAKYQSRPAFKNRKYQKKQKV